MKLKVQSLVGALELGQDSPRIKAGFPRSSRPAENRTIFNAFALYLQGFNLFSRVFFKLEVTGIEDFLR